MLSMWGVREKENLRDAKTVLNQNRCPLDPLPKPYVQRIRGSALLVPVRLSDRERRLCTPPNRRPKEELTNWRTSRVRGSSGAGTWALP